MSGYRHNSERRYGILNEILFFLQGSKPRDDAGLANRMADLTLANRVNAVFSYSVFFISRSYATDLLFSKATYYKKRVGLGSPQWHFTTYPSVLLTEFPYEKNIQ